MWSWLIDKFSLFSLLNKFYIRLAENFLAGCQSIGLQSPLALLVIIPCYDSRKFNPTPVGLSKEVRILDSWRLNWSIAVYCLFFKFILLQINHFAEIKILWLLVISKHYCICRCMEEYYSWILKFVCYEIRFLCSKCLSCQVFFV